VTTVTDPADRAMSFGSIAADYDRLRPAPPAEAVDWLLPYPREVVIDLGAGTGLLSRAIAATAGRVIAVEPDDRMRAVLARRSAGVEVLPGRGEAIPLSAGSADAVLVASAWHWLDPDLAVPEIGRVLRDRGRLGVIWTGREPRWLPAEEWFASGDEDTARHSVAEQAVREREGRQVALPDAAVFLNIKTATFRFTRTMTVIDLIDWLTTYSRVITASDEVKAAGRARATAALADKFPGATEIAVPMRSRCWRADRVPRSR
jgi:SAM-dependent methyltransferase